MQIETLIDSKKREIGWGNLTGIWTSSFLLLSLLCAVSRCKSLGFYTLGYVYKHKYFHAWVPNHV